jgi:6-phosphogluconolactonase/glucosamine-6-phosphate isomerase/deaminase
MMLMYEILTNRSSNVQIEISGLITIKSDKWMIPKEQSEHTHTHTHKHILATIFIIKEL